MSYIYISCLKKCHQYGEKNKSFRFECSSMDFSVSDPILSICASMHESSSAQPYVFLVQKALFTIFVEK